MPPNKTQIANERIAAILDILEEEGTIPAEHADALRSAEGIGDAAEVAQAHKNGNKP